MDDGKVTVLTLLDLSVAFDTIDHTIILRRLDDWFRVNGKVLDWFKSYLSGRSQRIKLGNCLSSRSDPELISLSESPNGQFLVLCFLHSIPLHSVAWFRGILSPIISMLMIGSCIFPFHQATLLQHWMVNNHDLASVQSWMSTNKLKLKPDKTEFLLIGNEWQRSKYLSMFPIELLGVKSYPAKSARNLGVIFDKNFSFRSHISAICSSCIYHIRDLRRIRRHLDLDSAK